MPTVQGFISVTDLVDGVVGNAVIFTNENHTYVADADGVIAAGEISMFTNDVFVEAGVVNITYDAGTDLLNQNNNTFRLATTSGVVNNTTQTVVSGTADLDINLAGTEGDADVTLTITDKNTANVTGFFDAGGPSSVLITIPVSVRTTSGTVTYNKTISISKAIGGSAPYVRMTSSDQTVEYPYLGSTPKTGQANIVFNARAFNTPGSVGTGTNTGLWFSSTDNTTFTLIDGTETGITLVGENTDVSSITVTTGAFNTLLGTARRVIFRFVRQASANVVANHEIFDQITAFRVDDAESGYTTYLEVTDGTTAFKNGIAYDANNAATYGDLKVNVFAGDTAVTVTNASDITYQWTKNGVDLVASDLNLNDAAQKAIGSDYGIDEPNIRINAADVADNGADVFGCSVDFTFDG